MAHKALSSIYSLDACTFQLQSWSPFNFTKHLDSSRLCTFKPVLSHRSADNLDFTRLSLLDEDKPPKPKREQFHWIPRKRRRRASRSVSGQSSDKSCRRRCCSVGPSAACATCSDFPITVGTDSSGELFVNGSYDISWASETPLVEAKRDSLADRETLTHGIPPLGCIDGNGHESGYGSEPGYRGDGEFGYDDELDEEEDDRRATFWGDDIQGVEPMEIVEESTFLGQKNYYRCRRKKHEWKFGEPLR